jgi:hypothetical protein
LLQKFDGLAVDEQAVLSAEFSTKLRLADANVEVALQKILQYTGVQLTGVPDWQATRASLGCSIQLLLAC